MRPFFPPLPHQIGGGGGGGGGNDPNLSQGIARIPTLPLNPSFPPPPRPQQSPMANVAANFAGLLGNPMATAAATQGMNPLVALQLLGQAQQLQNLGFLAAAALQQQQQHMPQPLLLQNLNQVAGLANPQVNANSGVFPSNGGFAGGNAGVGPSGLRPIAAAAKEMQMQPSRSPSKKNHRWNGGAMANHVEDRADGVSNFASENAGRSNFATNQNRGGRRGASDMMSQNSRFNPGRNVNDGRPFGRNGGRGGRRPFSQGRGRGSDNWREGKSNLTNCEGPILKERRRRPPIIYDENEVKQWREARKKNYPTSANIKKKLAPTESNSENNDDGTKLRRQQLKEVLAKQQELGFEVAEIPPGYLSEPESQANQKRNNGKTARNGDRLPNRLNKKRANYDRRNFRSKRPKRRNDAHAADAMTAKSREPTLLQKLLSGDIRRDKHKLLHVFKFMVLNNFFQDWPRKPLEFPSVKVKQAELESDATTKGLDHSQNADTKVNDDILVEQIVDQKDSSSTDAENTDDDDSDSEAEAGCHYVSEECNLADQDGRSDEEEITE